MKRQILVLGAGFGGLEVSTLLAERLVDHAEVTLIDQNDSFLFGFSKLDVLFRGRDPEELRLPYARLLTRGVDFRQERIVSIDPHQLHVRTDKNYYDPHVLVIALGADYDIGATPGLLEGGYEFYSVEGAERLRDQLTYFEGGKVVISVLGIPFKCPPAPYEGAMMLHDLLVERGIRDRSTIHVITPQPAPIPVSPEASVAVEAAMSERGIKYTRSSRVRSIDAAAGVAHLKDHEEPFDLFIGIPVHKVPDVLVEGDLTDEGWVHVDPATLMTRYPGIYAIGDCVELGIPRAGVFAEAAARSAADHIAVSMTGGAAPPFRGKSDCYVEFGSGEVARISIDFQPGVSTNASVQGPSTEFAQDKVQFATDRRKRWFGL
ncbi:MAG TPA: FAD-dependent oxidoreductase [Nocardioidaceae bacterium]|nr:FAD-dependent oxidoreductase [Nocardioidaceae bacterium]